jgi:hypothetical protein
VPLGTGSAIGLEIVACMQRKTRRRVDWSVKTGADPACARLATHTIQPSGLAHIATSLIADPSPQTADPVAADFWIDDVYFFE